LIGGVFCMSMGTLFLMGKGGSWWVLGGVVLLSIYTGIRR